MELSARLQAVADFVDEGLRIADVGTDHGYIPIFLVEAGKCPSAIASDVRQGPLNRARKHIEQHQLEERIQTRICNGLEGYTDGEADCLILAGMGGSLMIQIMTEGKTVISTMKELVLEPQTEVKKVREWLLSQGYSIVAENMVLDEGKYYPIFKVSVAKKPSLYDKQSRKDKQGRELALRYGAYLLQNRNAVLQQYLHKEYEQKQVVFHELSTNRGWKAIKRKSEILKDMQMIISALDYCKTGPSGKRK